MNFDVGPTWSSQVWLSFFKKCDLHLSWSWPSRSPDQWFPQWLNQVKMLTINKWLKPPPPLSAGIVCMMHVKKKHVVDFFDVLVLTHSLRNPTSGVVAWFPRKLSRKKTGFHNTLDHKWPSFLSFSSSLLNEPSEEFFIFAFYHILSVHVLPLMLILSSPITVAEGKWETQNLPVNWMCEWNPPFRS